VKIPIKDLQDTESDNDASKVDPMVSRYITMAFSKLNQLYLILENGLIII